MYAQSLDFSGIDEAARDAVASGEVPGAVIVVGQADHVLYRGTFGLPPRGAAVESMTEDTVFDIASLTKPLATTLAVLELAERGKLSLDVPIGTYLPSCTRRGATMGYRDVTIRRLLTHTAGLPGIPPSGSMRGGFPAAAKALAVLKLDYAPGTGQQYSDTGFILLGEIVRRVSGVGLDRYLQRTIFGPSGLRSTAFKPAGRPPREDRADRVPRRAAARRHRPRSPARALGGVAGHAGCSRRRTTWLGSAGCS
jgi:CubicO group peptidase (beta-lactamase class C family)